MASATNLVEIDLLRQWPAIVQFPPLEPEDAQWLTDWLEEHELR